MRVLPCFAAVMTRLHCTADRAQLQHNFSVLQVVRTLMQDELLSKRRGLTPSRAAPRTPAPGDAAINNELAALFAKRQSTA